MLSAGSKLLNSCGGSPLRIPHSRWVQEYKIKTRQSRKYHQFKAATKTTCYHSNKDNESNCIEAAAVTLSGTASRSWRTTIQSFLKTTWSVYSKSTTRHWTPEAGFVQQRSPQNIATVYPSNLSQDPDIHTLTVRLNLDSTGCKPRRHQTKR